MRHFSSEDDDIDEEQFSQKKGDVKINSSEVLSWPSSNQLQNKDGEGDSGSEDIENDEIHT